VTQPTSRAHRLSEIVTKLGGELVGAPDVEIRRMATLENAGPGDLAFVTNAKYLDRLKGTRASAVILAKTQKQATQLPRILCDDPYVYYARAAQLLNPDEHPAAGVHPQAVVEAGAQVAASAAVGPFCHVARGARLGERVVLAPGCVVGEDAQIGEDGRLGPSVTIYARSVIGKRALIHAGAVIGADGFGLAPQGGRWIKIPQTGRVVIGDDVEIGANTTIDRGALDDTVIEDGVKLDNQIQIAHNVHVGAHTAIAAFAGIAGSARIGKHCLIGGAARIMGHIQIADRVTVTATSFVTKSIRSAGTYSSALPAEPALEWAKTVANLRRLDRPSKRVREMKAGSKPGTRKGKR
jgi:UDP-3-O-[3-hydroxymyristoyl] glucosamine N-acyltransferase